MEYIQKCKNHLHNTLNFPFRKSAKIINGILLFLVLWSISLLPLYFFDLPPAKYNTLVTFEKIILTIFSFEYVIRVWISPSPLRYIFSFKGFIDLVSILPFYISLFIPFSNPEIFVSLRVLRLLKFDEVFGTYNTSKCPNKKDILHKSISIFPSEHVEYVVQRHPLIFILFAIPPLFFLFIAMVLFLAIPFFWVSIVFGFIALIAAKIAYLKNWIDQNYDIMLITNERVVFQQRELFGFQSNAVSYNAIHNVLSNNIGFIKWIFRYGDIKIESANRDATLDFLFAPNPTEVVDQITKHIKKKG